MRSFKCFIVIIAMLAIGVSAAGKPVHIFILSGQSNMAGMKPEAGFVPEAKKLFADGEVVYIKVARGGQPIRFWVTEWNAIAKKHGLKSAITETKYYKPILQQYRKLLEKHPNPATVTFCWMQGERDAKESLSAAYPDAMNQLIANLRRDLKQPKMAFVIGRLSDCLTTDHWNAVRRAQVDVANKDPQKRGAWVDTDDLNDKEKNGKKRNDLHYTRDGYALFGRRLARQAKAIADGKKPAADGRPGSAGEKPQVGIDLFDGKSLAGWEHFLVDPNLKMADVWSVRDGLLICKGKPMGYIATKKLYTHYRLIVEWRWAPGKPATNSGVLMRIIDKPRALPKCVEAQLQHGKAGDIYGFHGFKVSGDKARFIQAESKMIGKLTGVKKIKGAEKKPGEWNKYDITFNQGDLKLIINGELVNQATDCDVVPGKIGLQSEGGEIHFRNIKLMPLGKEAPKARAPKKKVKIQKPGSQVEAAKEVTLGDGDSARKVTVRYLISLPESYDKQEKCPLMIFLHGAGERGDDLNRVRIHGPPKIVSKKNTTPFIIVSPQCPRKKWWNIDALSRMLDHILATTKADPDRLYLTGLSMGGYGTWAWTAKEPKRFAAAIPICGGGDPKTAGALVDIPIWVFHGAKDSVVPLARSEVMIDGIKKAGGTKVKLTVYPEADHDSWTETYDNPEIYKWLLQHKR